MSARRLTPTQQLAEEMHESLHPFPGQRLRRPDGIAVETCLGCMNHSEVVALTTWLKTEKAKAWEVGYLRGVMDVETESERADNPYAKDMAR